MSKGKAVPNPITLILGRSKQKNLVWNFSLLLVTLRRCLSFTLLHQLQPAGNPEGVESYAAANRRTS